ncbi:MAG: ribosomal protein S18-alanine N-acetyltransferase [Anaerolineaceae bacterium]
MNGQVEIPVSIRRMEVRDIERVREIDRLSFTLTWSENSYMFELTQNVNSRLWVAEVANQPAENKKVVGILGAWMIVDEVHIATLAVDPAYRQMHIASQLLDHTLRQAGKEGAVISRLEVRAGNVAARKLYEKFGYYPVAVRPKYYVDNGEDALLMDMNMLQSGYISRGAANR